MASNNLGVTNVKMHHSHMTIGNLIVHVSERVKHTWWIFKFSPSPVNRVLPPLPVQGEGCDPPPLGVSFQTKCRRASRKRPADCSRGVLAIGGIIFGPRSIFDPVMAGQMSNFREFHDFSTSRVDSIKTICCSGMKPSPACSPFNYA